VAPPSTCWAKWRRGWWCKDDILKPLYCADRGSVAAHPSTCWARRQWRCEPCPGSHSHPLSQPPRFLPYIFTYQRPYFINYKSLSFWDEGTKVSVNCFRRNYSPLYLVVAFLKVELLLGILLLWFICRFFYSC
jgi:hypothetical protein